MKITLKAGAFLLIMTIVCGLLYTLAVMGIAQVIFPYQANGSIIQVDGKKYGCELLGQQFEDDAHLWGRVMNVDTASFIDEAGNPVMYAWPSNLSPASEEYEELVAQRVEKIREAHPGKAGEAIPVDLVTCSGSGLDPHISPAAAEFQVDRIASASGRTPDEVRGIIEKYTEGRFLGIFGEPRVNVLKVNLALEGIL